MREDQLQRLKDLSERLADSFILEADPTEWSGDGVSPADLSQEDRGNRYWCKKNAMATGGVLRFVLDVVGKHTNGKDDAEEKDADLEKKIREAESRATAAVNRALDKAKKQAHA